MDVKEFVTVRVFTWGHMDGRGHCAYLCVCVCVYTQMPTTLDPVSRQVLMAALYTCVYMCVRVCVHTDAYVS